jgi:uncharacterized protein
MLWRDFDTLAAYGQPQTLDRASGGTNQRNGVGAVKQPFPSPGLALAPAILAVLAALGCAPEDARPVDVSRQSPIIPLDSGTVRIETGADTLHIRVEIAETPDQQRLGLMERTALPEGEGMIFVYDEPQPASAPFYMFRTRIPLDIAFMDEEGRIVAIRQMEPCISPVADLCPRYTPDVPFAAALEVSEGFLERAGIAPGDRVVLVR